jgi:hypothetical protein
MPPMRWARLHTDVNLNVRLRRGGWYRVLELRALEAVLDVCGARVTLPRPFLEVAETPPRQWTVVPRPRDAVRVPHDWGARYAVCPSCRGRQPVHGLPSTMRCQRCNGLFEIALRERDLTAGRR